MSQFHFWPEEYTSLIRSEVPLFDELQERVVEAAQGRAVSRILELGTGTGETSRRVLEAHPDATLAGIDLSPQMLSAARDVLPTDQIEGLNVQALQDPLPEGPFDLVISALTIHHLDGLEKADLFTRVRAEMKPGGRFVMADVIVPENPLDAVAPLTPEHDKPSTIDELIAWLEDAHFSTRVVWNVKDLAVFTADNVLDR